MSNQYCGFCNVHARDRICIHMHDSLSPGWQSNNILGPPSMAFDEIQARRLAQNFIVSPQHHLNHIIGTSGAITVGAIDPPRNQKLLLLRSPSK